MIKRILTAIIGIPLLIFIIQSGGILLFASLIIITSLGLWEYVKSVNKNQDIKINYIIEIVLGVFLLFTFYFYYKLIVPSIIIVFIFIFIIEIIYNRTNILGGIYSFFGLFYIPLLLGHMLLFEKMPNGTWFLWLVFIISFSTDTFAYFIGIRFGSHKLSPDISPKKSIEGAIGGVIGSIVMTVLYGYLLNYFNLLCDIPLYYYGILALVTSILAQFGDLTASLIKRYFGIKDFGNIFPGHGGVLDRFDSIIFSTPIVYYSVVYFFNGVIS